MSLTVAVALLVCTTTLAQPWFTLHQADGRRDLELNANRGDAGDPFPGSTNATSFTATTTPSSNSFAGSATCVAITGIPAPSAAMTVGLAVRCIVKAKDKDLKDITKEGAKELAKERPKELLKERPKEQAKDRLKDGYKEIKEKEFKEFKEVKEIREDKFTDTKFTDTKFTDRPGLPGGGGRPAEDYGPTSGGDDVASRLVALEETVRLLVDTLGGAVGGGQDGPTAGTEPFIGGGERPDLGHDSGGPELQSLRAAMEAGSAEAKAQFDALPPQ